MQPSRDIARLIEIMAALRTPGTGCPWDLEQDFASIAPYTIEEAYEVADAIARGDKLDLKDELGDLLLQVVFHARMAEEEGSFAFPDVVEAITSKLIRRHPHVFGDARDLSPAEVKALWHRIKAEEKADKAAAHAAAGLPPKEEDKSVLAGVAHGLPALSRAWKLQARASTVGFDWNDARLVLDKIREETQEIEEALAGGDKAAIHEEIGDLLFVIANLARHVDAEPEGCLAAANAKFERRFKGIEAALEAEGRTAKEASLEEMEALWQAVKKAEKASG
ncbi:nucleoside triphosphate pyrophosphohydrolase [Bosea sp. SSUT16]|uniref:Nucleoside triphosphate pyrophosphohydrolase n=1 Tax=Bosea spartocytisi TaxID=2773451 RepID=A0A927I109_9HYPH|nr:nucleoside triphosphate pyrophosphohydrolase [Bosea spartocytisi]MBD3847859.1 nucleoside triphosphate pyrophosphohydrolase [Bosea spartocytisi]MCT4471485.1 nucleoside triphosphate pyrophosphohydrolase [Bosea spartocytisi]